jgi:hypothetical protein
VNSFKAHQDRRAREGYYLQMKANMMPVGKSDMLPNGSPLLIRLSKTASSHCYSRPTVWEPPRSTSGSGRRFWWNFQSVAQEA